MPIPETLTATVPVPQIPPGNTERTAALALNRYHGALATCNARLAGIADLQRQASVPGQAPVAP